MSQATTPSTTRKSTSLIASEDDGGWHPQAAIEEAGLNIVTRVTASVGVASGPSTAARTTIHRADDALLSAKHNGRNRVILA
jgi:GGDEF domain-containing protein